MSRQDFFQKHFKLFSDSLYVSFSYFHHCWNRYVKHLWETCSCGAASRVNLRKAWRMWRSAPRRLIFDLSFSTLSVSPLKWTPSKTRTPQSNMTLTWTPRSKAVSQAWSPSSERGASCVCEGLKEHRIPQRLRLFMVTSEDVSLWGVCWCCRLFTTGLSVLVYSS